MDISNLKMTLKACQKISPTVLSDYVTKEELDEKLSGYVTEAPIDDEEYARKNQGWVEIDYVYHRPEILELKLITEQPSYVFGQTVVVTGIAHRESNIIHITKLSLFRESTFISEITPSETLTVTAVSDSFVFEHNTTFTLVAETDIGLEARLEFVLHSSDYDLYSGPSTESAIDSSSITTLRASGFIEHVEYTYELTENSYIYWCSIYPISNIRQDSVYPIDYALQPNTITHDGQIYKVYRTTTMLLPGTWKFSLEKALQ